MNIEMILLLLGIFHLIGGTLMADSSTGFSGTQGSRWYYEYNSSSATAPFATYGSSCLCAHNRDYNDGPAFQTSFAYASCIHPTTAATATITASATPSRTHTHAQTISSTASATITRKRTPKQTATVTAATIHRETDPTDEESGEMPEIVKIATNTKDAGSRVVS